PLAPQFSSSQAVISVSRCPSPSGGRPIRIRTGNRRSASIIISFELAAMMFLICSIRQMNGTGRFTLSSRLGSRPGEAILVAWMEARERSMNGEVIGTSVRRKEDFRFLTGAGNYTDDINRPGQLYAYILRSPHAHAEIAGIDTGKAGAAPGVSAVFTGADVQVGGLPCGWLVNSKDGSPMVEPPHPVLAAGKVRHVGDPVAVVIADTLEQAKDAAELIEVSYNPLPAVVAADDAIRPGKPQLFDNAPDNICF